MNFKPLRKTGSHRLFSLFYLQFSAERLDFVNAYIERDGIYRNIFDKFRLSQYTHLQTLIKRDYKISFLINIKQTYISLLRPKFILKISILKADAQVEKYEPFISG